MVVLLIFTIMSYSNINVSYYGIRLLVHVASSYQQLVSLSQRLSVVERYHQYNMAPGNLPARE